jgi:hypothetical protein
MRRRIFVIWVAAAATLPLAAQTVPAIGLGPASLDWLAGHWATDSGGATTEEHWTSPAGGALIGMNKGVRDGRVSFEFLRIGLSASGLTYFASPGGRPATPFRAIELEGRRVVFENKEHDFPQRILYWMDAEGRLNARVEGSIAGQARSQEWVFTRSR